MHKSTEISMSYGILIFAFQVFYISMPPYLSLCTKLLLKYVAAVEKVQSY